jgi:rhodanese-related sulfurtransferase
VNKTLGKIVIIFGLVGLISFGWYKWSGDNHRQGLVDLASGKRLMVVNVLESEHFKDCHIKGSVNVPFDQLEILAQQLDKDTEIIFYCSNYMCTGSGKAAKLFQQKGFKRVWAYEAGMNEWYRKGLPVEGGCKSAYLSMQNEPIEEDQDSEVTVITTEELQEKLGF